MPLFSEPNDRNQYGFTFDAWMGRVDRAVMTRAGVSVFDLADQPYWDLWRDGVDPRDAAAAALEDEGFPFDA